MSDRRIVITGRGVCSPLGCDWATFAEALRRGEAATPSAFPGAEGGPLCFALPDLGVALGEGASAEAPLGAVATEAARQALAEAGLLGEGPLDGVGLVMNTVFGPSTALETYLERLRERGPRSARPALFVDTLLSMPASRLGIALGLRGSTAVLGGSSPFETALDWLRDGRDAAIVVGGGEYLSRKCLRYYEALTARSGAGRARPAQSAAFVVLERSEDAEARGARALGELLGSGGASEAQEAPVPWPRDGRAFVTAMREALDDAQLAPGEIAGAVVAAGDDASEEVELSAVEAVLGAGAAVVRPKRLLGEALGGSAALGLLTALGALEEGGGTPGRSTPGRATPGSTGVVVNAFEMGGATASLVVGASR